MRKDSVGFFWDDTPPPKPPKKTPEKRQPPAATWLNDLPYLEEALAFPVELMGLDDVIKLSAQRDEFVVDVESYANYFCAVFTSLATGKVMVFESYEFYDEIKYLNPTELAAVLGAVTTVGFNSLNYDVHLLAAACAGKSVKFLKTTTRRIIEVGERGEVILREAKIPEFKGDHYDLIEVAPLMASLKTYAGRLHTKKMQDLPFPPDTVLTREQMAIVRWYCVNDNASTIKLLNTLKEHLDLRGEMSNEYKVDLRSKSDAQIAEKVIESELRKIIGRVKRPVIEVGTTYRYNVPHFLRFTSPLLQNALATIANAKFQVDDTGSIGLPKGITDLVLDINGSVYHMGIGGLHSSEKNAAHYTDSEHILIDKDVTSYYPFIILNQGLSPAHLGQPFLTVYKGIVDRRIAAKRAGQDIIAQSLKIVVNGSYGKLGSKYSLLYAPNLLIQVTLTGQLSLLLLIEWLEMAGIRVVSANTDGIVIKCKRTMLPVLEQVVAGWEAVTNFATEETRYMGLFSRDVNNYIATKQKFDKAANCWVEEIDGTKTKGAYANPWASTKNPEFMLHKNPTTTICVEAVEAYLCKGVPVTTTIRGCNDIRKFVTVRTVKGGAVLVKSTGNEYIGKTVRWYYSTQPEGEMVYALSGNRVPRSDGSRPVMVLPDELPADMDYEWYENEAARILSDIAAVPQTDTAEHTAH